MTTDDLVTDLRRLADNAKALGAVATYVLTTEAADKIECLRSALRPFGNYADDSGAIPDGMVITLGSEMAKRQLTMVDCRRAAATLK